MIRSHSSRRNGVSKSGRQRKRKGKGSGGPTRVPARSRRYSPAEHARALSLISSGMTREAAAKAIGCTTESLRRWSNEAKQNGVAAAPGNGAATDTGKDVVPAAPGLTRSSAPRDPGAGLGEHEVKAILDYKKKHPSMGPAQIRAQLKRFLGWRVSIKAIARVLRQAGYAPVHGKGRPVGDEHPRRFEAPHRNALWQLDYGDNATMSISWPSPSRTRTIASA